MKYCFFVLIVVIISAFDSTAQINAQSQEAKEAEQLNAQVLKLYQAGKFSEALPLAERSAALHDRIFGSKNEQTAGALRNLAEVHLAKKNKKESEVIYDQYLNVLGNALGETNPTFIKALDRYVCLLVGIDRRSKALDIQKRLYRLDNNFDFDDTEKTRSKNTEMAGLLIGKIVHMPRPDYLPEAKQAGISGSVVFKITVDETGKVIAVKSLCGHPLLVKGAEASITQARYKPTIIAGQPVKVIGFAIYNFVI